MIFKPVIFVIEQDSYIPSAGIGFLVRLHIDLPEKGSNLALLCKNNNISNIFKDTGLDKILRFTV